MIHIILLAIVLLMASFGTAAAEEAPSMWMVQEDDTIKLMVNTDAVSEGIQADIIFNSAIIDITNVDFTDSPWQPMEGEPGWINHGNYIRIALTGFSGVAADEYQIATMSVDCTAVGDVEVSLTNVVVGAMDMELYDLTYNCPAVDPSVTDALVSIGDMTGSNTAVLPITITNIANAGSCDVTLTYDPNSVVATEAAFDGIDYMEHTYVNFENADAGSITIGAFQAEDIELSDFTLAEITLAPVMDGPSCDLTLTVNTLTDATPECNAIPYTISSGTYTVMADGDFDGDGELDFSDVLYITYHVIGMTGYEDIDASADFNNDDEITIADAMYLAKHLLGIEGFNL